MSTTARNTADLIHRAKLGIGPFSDPGQRIDAEKALEQLGGVAELYEGEARRWAAWSSDRFPDEEEGDLISARADGTIMLDDSVTSWNPLRALRWFAERHAELGVLLEDSADALEEALAERGAAITELESVRTAVTGSFLSLEEALCSCVTHETYVDSTGCLVHPSFGLSAPSD